MSQEFDLVVVGAGSGGYAAARTARDLGASVALVDRGPLGGLCILAGCMPSKTLIATGDAVHEVGRVRALGVETPPPRVHWDEVIARKRATIRGFADYRVAGIETFPVFRGEARFRDASTIEVGGETLVARRGVVVATGSRVAPAVIPGLAEAGFIDSDAALDLDAPPRSLIVLGGGYIGTELGQFFHRVGVATTIVLRSPHLLSGEDRDVGDGLTEALREEGLTIETRAQVHRVSTRGGKKIVHATQGGEEREYAADEILYALGRMPNVDGLDLERAGVTYHEITGIAVDDTLRTSNPRVFAVGDVTGQYLLVHVAIQQGEIAARNALRGERERADYRVSRSHTVFSDPQVAIAGETERELAAAGVPFLKGTYPFDDHGKAIAIGKTRGFVKMLAAPSDGRILGCAILGADASDLIHAPMVAMWFGATVFDYMRIPHLHPTMAEILTYPAEEIAEQIRAGAPVAVAAG